MYIWKSLTYHDRVEHFTKGSGTVFNTGKVADPCWPLSFAAFFQLHSWVCWRWKPFPDGTSTILENPLGKLRMYITHTAYTYIYIHTYPPTYLHACMHAYRQTYIHTYIHACMHAYIHTSFYLPQTQRDLRLFEFIVILREVYMYSSKHEICGLNVKWYNISCLYVIGRFTGHTSVTSRLHPNCSWTSTIPIDLQVWVMLPNSMCETPNY